MKICEQLEYTKKLRKLKLKSHIYGLDRVISHLIYLNHWSSITLELNIPFFFHMIVKLLEAQLQLVLVISTKTQDWKVFFIAVDMFW